MAITIEALKEEFNGIESMYKYEAMEAKKRTGIVIPSNIDEYERLIKETWIVVQEIDD